MFFKGLKNEKNKIDNLETTEIYRIKFKDKKRHICWNEKVENKGQKNMKDAPNSIKRQQLYPRKTHEQQPERGVYID